MECIHCHKTVEIDRDMKAWTGETTYYDPDLLDGTPDGHNDGKACIDGDLHEVES